MVVSRITRRAFGAVLPLALLVAACGKDAATTAVDVTVASNSTPGSGATPGEPNPAALPFGIQRCDPEMPTLRADSAYYRDQPIYVANEQPFEEVRAWAVTRPGFQEIWIDRQHNGWLAVGFSENAPARQAELETQFPDVGVVAVQVAATDAELQALRAEVQAAFEGLTNWGMGHSVARGMVEVSVPILDEATLTPLAPLAGPMLCVSGTDPGDAVPDGPQPTEGEGWRLLGTDRTGEVYRTGVATTQLQYEQLWERAGLPLTGPPVDFETEVVIWFGAVYGSGCPIRLDDVVVDIERRVVHGQFVQPGSPVACNSDANPEAYVVALSRARLPDAPFAIQLHSEDPPPGVPEERTTVQVNLRPEGATASPEDLVVQFLDGDPIPRPITFEPSLVIEAAYPSTVQLDLACSTDILGPLNGVMWRATSSVSSAGPPEEWTQGASNELVEAELLLTTNPAHLRVTVNDSPVDYEPIPASAHAQMTCT